MAAAGASVRWNDAAKAWLCCIKQDVYPGTSLNCGIFLFKQMQGAFKGENQHESAKK
jgi:hypothetical protein